MEIAFFKDIILPNLPSDAGIYKFIGENEELLYVGKAKNIKKRVASYFLKSNILSSRIKLLVKKADRIDFTVVETEHDALLLENSLIKKHQPRYNIQLKDDKSYPYIVIKNEHFPRVYLTRNKINDGAEYLGPYTSVNKVRLIMEFIKTVYTLRTCNYNLSHENIIKGKFKICLEYHLGNCLGPCEGLQTEEEYNKTVTDIKAILKGNTRQVINYLENQMLKYAENYEFELAAELKRKVELLENFQAKSAIVNQLISNVDVFGFESNQNFHFISYLKIINGTIIQTQSIQVNNIADESKEDLLIFSIFELRTRFDSKSSEIIVPFEIQYPDKEIKITVPERGDKKKLLDLAQKNAISFKEQTLTEKDKRKIKTGPIRILEQLQKDFKMAKLPEHIECFDNSNIQGSHPVASMIVYKNGIPSKKDYRHYNIKSVDGPNDFASMEEVVYRRYKRLFEENQPLPDLVLIDGGKGQLNAAMLSLEKLGILNKITLAAIAKRLEEIYFPGDPVPLHLSKRSESLKLLQQIRNEAHRFAITFHRNKRSKSALGTELTKIKGIGDKTAEKLLKHFKSIKKIKEADAEEIKSLVGEKASILIIEYFLAKK